MLQRIPLSVHLESFEGPLDLLLYLIQSHELDISKISLVKITHQYLAYVRLMQELNFDAASEFLVMAATLLHWKSRSLLPQDEKAAGNEVEDEAAGLSPDELVRRLQAHQRFLEAGRRLSLLPRLGEDVFVRAPVKSQVNRVWKDMSVTDLALSYQAIWIRARKRKQILKKETVSISEKMLELASRLPMNQLIEFRSLLALEESRSEIVATFLATLELSRLKKMRVYQEEAYSSIYLELFGILEEFEKIFISGFDSVSSLQSSVTESAVVV